MLPFFYSYERPTNEEDSFATISEVSYFLSSLPPNARRIGRVIRGHWSIENSLHWVLDVGFREKYPPGL